MPHHEERTFSFRLEFRAEFDDDYDGDDDGYAWATDLPELQQGLLRALINAATQQKAFTVRSGNRGRSTEDEMVLIFERKKT